MASIMSTVCQGVFLDSQLKQGMRALQSQNPSLKFSVKVSPARLVRVTAASDASGYGAATQNPPPAPPAQEGSGGLSPPVLLGAAVLAGAAVYAAATKLLPKSAEAPSGIVSEAASLPSASKKPAAKEPFDKKAAPAALVTIGTYFPNAVQDESFVRAAARELFSLGFSRDNCIALVNTCRDEVCRPLATYIDQEFGLSFNIAGLGGLINCGKTGLKAAMSHSPEFPCGVDGKPRERYVFFAFPHVSIGETGEVGSLLRRGRGKPSSACGALIAIKNGAKPATENDPEDAEFVTLRRKILSSPLCAGAGAQGPSLVDVTKACLQVITDDLENLISKTVDPATSDYAVITGVQIHSGNQIPGEPFRLERTVDYVAAGTMYAVIRGERRPLQVGVSPTVLKSM